MSKEDPKHGRWILPLVIAGLIGFTVVFVRALPAADVSAGTTTTTVSESTTTTVADSTTTTTLPQDIKAFLGELDRFEATTQELNTELNQANTDWENRGETGVSFDDTLASFEAVVESHQEVANQVAGTVVPDSYAEVWPDAITLSLDLVTKANAVIEGLRAPDDGTARRDAVAAYDEATAAFLAQVETVRAATP